MGIFSKSKCNYVYFALVILFAFMLQIDWPALFGLLSNEGRDQSILEIPIKVELKQPQEINFLIKQYDNAVKEIHERLHQESVLFAMKFSLVGAILALMFTSTVISFKNIKGETDPLRTTLLFNPPLIAMFCWAATITSAIIDTRIMYHTDLIVVLGTWIKNHVEPVLYSSSQLIGWENFLASKNLKSRLFTSQLYPLLRSDTSILTLFLFLANTIVFSIKRLSYSNNNKPFRTVCAVGSIGCFVIFFLVSIHFQYDKSISILSANIPWIIVCLLTSSLGILFSSLYWLYQSDIIAKNDKDNN